MDAQMKVDRCMTRLLMRYPFWGNLLLTFDVQPSETATQTMATNGKGLWYNPPYVEQQDEEIICTDLAHEGGHKMFLDHMRRGSRDQKLWNIATDYRINLYLKDSGLKLGDDYLYDEQFRGMDAEEIYDFLEQNPDSDAAKNAEAKGGCGCGGLKDHPSQQPSQSRGDQEGDEGQGSSSGTTTIENVDFGEAEVLMEIANALAFAKNRGSMPAGLEAEVKEVLDPKIRWEQIVQQFMEQCNSDDYDWTKRDRRMMSYDMYLPALESDGVDTFVVSIDTSGSTRPFIPQFLGEISKIASVLNFNRLIVIFCDARVAHVDEYEKHDLPIRPAKVYGGGGTDFRPPFAWLEEHDIYPKGMVYLTDTYGSFPEPPDFPVLWTAPVQCQGNIPFGERVDIE